MRIDRQKIDEVVDSLKEAELEILIHEAKRMIAHKKRTNSAFFSYYDNNDRYLVLMGGAGSGKSVFAGQKILDRLVHEPKHKILIVRKVAKTIRESCFAQLVSQAREYYPEQEWILNRTDMKIVCPASGGEIIFTGCDDVEKLKSIHSIDSVWIEEASELTRDDFLQIDLRLRGETATYKQIILTFNPISLLHWLKAEFFDRNRSSCTTSRTTFLDNRYIDDTYRNTLESMQDRDPYFYQVYCLGNWGHIGRGVFPGNIIATRIEQVKDIEPERGGFNDKGKFASGEGDWTIYKHPEKNHFYVAGSDVAEGLEHGDYSTIQILDAKSYEQVAVFRAHIDIDRLAEELEKGGYYYNTALLVPEKNFNSSIVLNLERMSYPKIYLRTQESIGHEVRSVFGWVTTKLSKNAAITDLIELVRDHCDLLHDVPTFEEMLVFSRDAHGKLGAASGAHDDLVMALAIALQGCLSGQQQSTAEPKIDYDKLERLPKDYQDDYYNMDKARRREFAEKHQLWQII